MSNIVQSTYNRYMDEALAPGSWASTRRYEADTLIAGGTIGFGLACSVDADGKAVAGGSLFRGVAMRDITLVHSDPDELDKYIEGENVAVADQGDIWVLASGAVEKQTQVHYNTGTGAIGASGTAIAGAFFLMDGGDGDRVKIRLGAIGVDVTT